MKFKNLNLKRTFAIISTAILVFFAASCKKCKSCKPEEDRGVRYDNETSTLIFSTQEVDGVFNPFFSTSGTDSNVVGMTQISMLSNDKNGKPTYGDKEAVVTKDLQYFTTGSREAGDQITTYYFVLKNNVKFSNGSPLTIKDVLFNYYVYLDPLYTGSSTIYSTDIVGLKEYRTQNESETEQEAFKERFKDEAEKRIEALSSAANDIFKYHKGESISVEKFKQYLQEEYVSVDEQYEYAVKDFEKAIALFKEELLSDFNNASDTYQNITFTDKDGTLYKDLLTTNVEAFLYNEGYLTWDKKEAKLVSSLTNSPEELKNWTKEQAINTVYQDKIPNSIEEVISFWGTASQLYDFIVNEAMSEYFRLNGKKIKNISGITFANLEGSVEVNGVTYAKPEYNEDGSVKDGYNEVLCIKIHNVDPKAIWNFAIGVAPMYYYSDEAHIKAFDYKNNFGVEYGNQDFLEKVVRDPAKIGVPVGGGAYAASKSSGGITGIESGDFNQNGVIYFERNPYFIMGPAKIKKVCFQVVASNQMLNALYNNEIDFVEPNAKYETVQELKNKASSGIGSKSIKTSGYGYIGINAGKVPDMAVRQAIMHAINTQECVDYYVNTASAIYRPMSTASWAYPEDCTPYYPYIGSKVPEDLSVVNPAYAEYVTSLGKHTGDTLTQAEQQNFIKKLVESAGYTINSQGVYEKNGSTLQYTFTIAGEETDHPAWNAMYHAGEILNKVGFNITVTSDAQALKKLSLGALTVWAAAWGSTIDPDMYQVYHKDSYATSVLNWGYKQILQNTGDKYSVEKALVEQLSELIDQGRQTTDEAQRASIYAEALDIIMQLAVELPTYQRDDLFAYNLNKIDESTLNSDTSPYKGLTSDLHNVSFNQAK